MAGVFSLESRPGGHSKYTLVIDGLKEARAAFALLPEVAKEEFKHAVFVTASEIVRLAKSNLVPGRGVQTGQLKASLGFRVTTRGEAFIGIRRGFNLAIPAKGGSALRSRGARLHVPTKIGHLVEFGHKRGKGRSAAAPLRFMQDAYRSQLRPFQDRVRAAGRSIEQQMAARASAARVARVV